jgi:hypothetical protein
MWMLHGAEADFSRTPALAVTDLEPASARTVHGDDIRGLLATVDGRRYVMNPGLDSADLVFDALPPKPGLLRSFVLEATGYYTILVPAEGEPQRALYDTLIREPGAFGRYSAELMAEASRYLLARLEEHPPR